MYTSDSKRWYVDIRVRTVVYSLMCLYHPNLMVTSESKQTVFYIYYL